MVCKEDVLTWFREAASYKRLDAMCALLHMCLPFELRYLGACLEERGKQDYQELRGAALAANSVERLAKELGSGPGPLDKSTRHRLTVYVSLLQSRNYACAQWLYSGPLRSDALDAFVASGAYAKDAALHTELLLLYTMALNHPAFTFDQKRYFGELVTRMAEPEAAPPPPGLGYALKAALPVHHLAVPEPPPGIPLPAEFVAPPALWPRPHFLGGACAPELAPFPPPLSPLVSRQSSPSASRSVSPARMYACRPPTHPKDPQPGFHGAEGKPGDEDAGEQPPHPWTEKLPNGLLPAKCPGLYLSGELQPLHLDAGGGSSSASSHSSDGHSPPDTPTGPGRGPLGRTPPGLPAELAAFAAPTVPYSAHYAAPPPPSTAFHHSRALYYSQAYRPHGFAPPPPPPAYQPNGELPPYLFPPHYLPVLYGGGAAASAAAAAAPLPPAKLASCYNCGLPGHAGADCKEPTIEEITQKKGYQLEYTTPPPPPPPDGALQPDKLPQQANHLQQQQHLQQNLQQ